MRNLASEVLDLFRSNNIEWSVHYKKDQIDIYTTTKDNFVEKIQEILTIDGFFLSYDSDYSRYIITHEVPTKLFNLATWLVDLSYVEHMRDRSVNSTFSSTLMTYLFNEENTTS